MTAKLEALTLARNCILREAVAEYDSSTTRNASEGLRDGAICDPGRMEGESLLTLYCDALDGNGCGGDVLACMEDGVGEYATLIDVDSEFRADLAAVGFNLESDTSDILYTVSDSGFHSATELTAAKATLVRAEYESREEESEDDDSGPCDHHSPLDCGD